MKKIKTINEDLEEVILKIEIIKAYILRSPNFDSWPKITKIIGDLQIFCERYKMVEKEESEPESEYDGKGSVSEHEHQ